MASTPLGLSEPASPSDVLSRVADVIHSRRQASPDASYVAKLLHKGTDTILKKVGEEAAEMLLAAKDMAHHPCEANRTALVGECADLWFHSLVALENVHIRPEEVLAELARREGLSGLEEFARRSAPTTSTP